MKVVKVQKKQGKKDVYWATIEYTKEELEKQFPSIDYEKRANDDWVMAFDKFLATGPSTVTYTDSKSEPMFTISNT